MKWDGGAKPFSAFFGFSYPAQLTLASIIGALLSAAAFGEKGKVVRSLIFGAVSTPLFVVAMEEYMQLRNRVFRIELAIVALVVFAPFVYVWKLFDTTRPPPEEDGKHD